MNDGELDRLAADVVQRVLRGARGGSGTARRAGDMKLLSRGTIGEDCEIR